MKRFLRELAVLACVLLVIALYAAITAWVLSPYVTH